MILYSHENRKSAPQNKKNMHWKYKIVNWMNKIRKNKNMFQVSCQNIENFSRNSYFQVSGLHAAREFFTISETFSKSGDPLLIERIIMHYLCLIREIVSKILTRVIIQRWVMTRVVIQPLNHKFMVNYDRMCFSWEGVCSFHGSIYFCRRLKHTLT